MSLEGNINFIVLEDTLNTKYFAVELYIAGFIE